MNNPPKDKLTLGATIAAEVFSNLGLPGGNFVANWAKRYEDHAQKIAAEVLIEEWSNGVHGAVNFDELDLNPLIEIIHRFSKAASDGAARDNLRFLAQVVSGQKCVKGSLDADKFRRWSNIIEQFTHDELVVVAQCIRCYRDPVGSESFDQKLQKSLTNLGYPKNEISALLTAVSRTGLILPASGWGKLVYNAGPWLDELDELTTLSQYK